MRRVTFDPSISLGAVLQLVVMLMALAAGFTSLRERLTAIEVQIAPLWREYIERHAIPRLDR